MFPVAKRAHLAVVSLGVLKFLLYAPVKPILEIVSLLVSGGAKILRWNLSACWRLAKESSLSRSEQLVLLFEAELELFHLRRLLPFSGGIVWQHFRKVGTSQGVIDRSLQRRTRV